MARKTLKIRTIIELVNLRNRESTYDPEMRQGWNSLLEAILHDADAYAGFGYYSSEELPEGIRPGIRYEGKHPAEDYAERFRDCDDTRRYYYIA